MRNPQTAGPPIARAAFAAIESLEGRTLLSSTIDGYTPDQIRHAYGFDQIDFGSVTANGVGQTIAIIDAFNAPNIKSDLQIFSQQFNLPAANLTVVNQTGGTTLPRTDPGWASEIAMDVEWAHAIAPGANILLVEANSDSTDDLMAAVNYARQAVGVSVISMSWGGGETLGFNANDPSSQQTLDSILTSPAGHTGVTFVAAAGDGGSGNVLWPASSTHVLAVGGTTLNLDDAGNILSETGWSGASRGYSKIENEPTWQQAVQSTGRRSISDVGYNGNASTGFAVYDSTPDGDTVNWQTIAGTSAGAPQWAAMIAIINQGLATLGKGPLDGPTQTLPQLYGLYSTKDSNGVSAYSKYFNDVTIGGGATTGYDLVSGLGSPKAAAIVAALSGVTGSGTHTGGGSTTTGGTTSGGTTSGGTTSGGTTTGGTATTVPIPDTDGTGTTTDTGGTPTATAGGAITGVFSQTPIATAIAGDAGKLRLTVTNNTLTRIDAPVTITLSLSSDAAASSDDAVVATLPIAELRMEAGGSKTLKLKFNYGNDALAAGTYYTVATIGITGSGTTPAEVVSATTTIIAAPVANVVAGFGGVSAVSLMPGKKSTVLVTLTNTGNITAQGTLGMTLVASADSQLDGSDAVLASLAGKAIRIKAGKTLRLKLKFVVPDLVGDQFLVASVSPVFARGSNDAGDDVAAINLQVV